MTVGALSGLLASLSSLGCLHTIEVSRADTSTAAQLGATTLSTSLGIVAFRLSFGPANGPLAFVGRVANADHFLALVMTEPAVRRRVSYCITFMRTFFI